MTWESDALLPLLGQARLLQGNFLRRVKHLGFELGDEALVGREKIHFEAPPGEKVGEEMCLFLSWAKVSRATAFREISNWKQAYLIRKKSAAE